MKIGRLQIGKKATNESHRFTLAAWAWPDGYWRWVVSYHPDRGERALRFGPSMDAGNMYRVGGHFGAWLRLPFVGSFSLSTQPYPYHKLAAT